MTGRHSSGVYRVCAACGHPEDRHDYRHPFALPHPHNLAPTGGMHRADVHVHKPRTFRGVDGSYVKCLTCGERLDQPGTPPDGAPNPGSAAGGHSLPVVGETREGCPHGALRGPCAWWASCPACRPMVLRRREA